MVDNSSEKELSYDVAIIGGGPSGSTVGSILKKYNRDLRVGIFEKEKFPREHVGESLLPAISPILDEIGAWDKVEAANFPIKVGATYRWGQNHQLWDFEFLPLGMFKEEPRPAKFEGQRKITAFQVERSRYDDILLRHAEELGCEVHEETMVRGIDREGDRVTALRLGDGRRVTARYFIDGSGYNGTLRRGLGIGRTIPTHLMNVAIWDYWENADWAVEIGVGGTRIQILSVGCGWIWFIPIGPTRTSLGFVCPVEYYKTCGKTPAELYEWAVNEEPRVRALTKNGRPEGNVRTTSDWSYISDRLAGENWFLVGESAGFADPILSGGVTLAHTSAREAAYSILEFDRGELDHAWLRSNYEDRQKKRVMQYIRFAEFWYLANGCFTDLEDHCAKLAQESGLKFTPREAFRWLSFGGLAHEDFLFPGVGGFDLLAVKEVTKMFTKEDGGDDAAQWEINRYNVFRLNLADAKKGHMPVYHAGRITRTEAYFRGGHLLPVAGLYGLMIGILKDAPDITTIANRLNEFVRRGGRIGEITGTHLVVQAAATLEAMLLEGWVIGKLDPRRPRMSYAPRASGASNFHPNYDNVVEEPAPREKPTHSKPREGVILGVTSGEVVHQNGGPRAGG